jgi:diacylglycerol kinase (ATP)
VVGVGGDGTTGNIANEILHSGAPIRLGVIPAGTGNDFSKTLGTDGASFDAVARRATETDDTRVDVGRIEDRFFLNSCGFGFDVAVLQGLAAKPWLPGDAVYLYTALRQLFRFPGLHVAVDSSASRRERSLHMMTVIANVPHFGGAFVIAPDAIVTDGELDAVTVLDARAGRRLSMLAAATRGTHARYREVIMERAPEFHISFDEPPFYETDGEVHRAASATLTVRCLPAALRVVTGDGGLRDSAGRSAPLVQGQR